MSILHNLLPVILLAVLAGAIPLETKHATSSGTKAETGTDYRLPTHVIPLHYTIELTPNILENDFTFTGESIIKIQIQKEDSYNITLHALDLVIDKEFTKLVDALSPFKELTPNATTIYPATEFLVLTFDKPIPLGSYLLKLKYNGKLHDDLKGFYRSYYTNEDGEKVWLATTQFEPTYARRAFPCFDEPALKAEFDISINHYDNYTAVSNMPFSTITKDTKNIAKQWTKFSTTPPMSTYLIAFVVSDFKYHSTDDGTFRVWSRSNAKRHGRYAQYTGQKELKLLNDYTGIPQSRFIPQMNNFAIPQFSAGAMENWGLVTYREPALLYEENVTTIARKQDIATVISHEFAHQWFGNLVSPLWWDYTWLNEGFANYFQYYITDQVEDTWRLMDQFVIKNLQETAFIADDSEDQHPMNAKVNSPTEISAIFDSISYSKAGSVIRMFSHALTEKVFQKGLKTYLNNMMYEAAHSDDLFKELTSVAAATIGKDDLTKALNLWANQAGYPVVTVTRDYATQNVNISQHRFLTTKTKNHTESWIIPINYATEKNPSFTDTKPSHWLSTNLTLTNVPKGWIIVNKQHTGYYRVNYDLDNWKLIIKNLTSANYEQIHVLNRAQILDDSFHLAEAGELNDHSVFLDVTQYLKQEVDYVPWHAAFRAFASLERHLANTDSYTLFKLYMLRLIDNLEKNVGYSQSDKDDLVTIFKRNAAMNWACKMGSKNCADAAHQQLLQHVFGSNRIPTDLQNVVLCAGIRSANATVWQKTFDLYESRKSQDERNAIIVALGCSGDQKNLQSLLAKSLDAQTKISPFTALQAVLVGSSSGVDIAFDFIDANVQKLLKDDKKKVLKVLNEVANRMTIQRQVDKLDKFITANKDMEEELKKQTKAIATKNIDWIKKKGARIVSFLNDQKLVPAKPKSNSQSLALPTFYLILLALTASLTTRIH